METYLTVRELAVKVHLSEQTIYRYVAKKSIPFHKIQRAVRFKPSEVELWMAKREKRELFAVVPNSESPEVKA